MEGKVLGVIVAGGRTPLGAIGLDDEAALTPFAGKYRFLDFAFATLANSGVTAVRVSTLAPAPALADRLDRLGQLATGRIEAQVLPLPEGEAPGRGRTQRILQALRACHQLAPDPSIETIVVLLADHILQLDLRRLIHAHQASSADVTVAAFPVPLDEARERTVLAVDGDRRVRDVQRRPARPALAPGSAGLAFAWAGDLVLRAGALPGLLAASHPPVFRPGEPGGLRVMAFDVVESDAPGGPHRPSPYWHTPTTVETYYDAQMNLCTGRPALDLYDPAWPLPAVSSGHGPAKVMADAAGRAGQALNALVSDGSLIRGGVVFNTVVGAGVLVESGAEVEDSVLLDGCRIGRGARVRRALIGPGAVVDDGEEIGFDAPPVAPAHRLASGLTVVPPALAVGSAAR